jgi:hypothetical protein
VCKLPDDFSGKEAFLAELERRIGEGEAHCAKERQATGTFVVGRRRILRQSWRDCPTTREPRRGRRPRFAARDREVRIAALQRYKAWLADYRRARLDWLAGLDVELPYGTYWLRRFANVRVQPPPAAAVTLH